jgi:hypothetical protein
LPLHVRLKKRVFNIPALADPILRFVCHKLGGEIIAPSAKHRLSEAKVRKLK